MLISTSQYHPEIEFTSPSERLAWVTQLHCGCASVFLKLMRRLWALDRMQPSSYQVVHCRQQVDSCMWVPESQPGSQ